MSSIDHLQLIERHREHRQAIRRLIESILIGFADEQFFHWQTRKTKDLLKDLGRRYPFVSMIYFLDEQGVQCSPNLWLGGTTYPDQGQGIDRSRRPYFLAAAQNGVNVVTDPYLSTANSRLCLSAATRLKSSGGERFLVMDVDLAKLLSYLQGDSKRRRLEPYFKAVYALIAVGLFSVAAALILSAGSELVAMLTPTARVPTLSYKSLSAIIYLTLALAVFDLGKTTLEEEVLLHKDIFRLSATRRTITRFIGAILIAVSIEALLMMFKGSLKTETELLGSAVWMMLAAVGLLIGLGIYVYLGCQAERILLKQRRREES
ncbi:MAG: PDC sensor domain-containing protein [Methylohalobius sp. ZOD2]